MTPDPSIPSRAVDADDLVDESAVAENDRSRMSFLEHLDELRRRLMYSAYAVFGSWAVAFYFWQPLYHYMVAYFGAHANGKVIYTQPMAGFTFSLKITLLAGTIAASPFVFSQLWLFVAPGLYAREKKVVIPFVVVSTLFFGAGAWFAHAVAFPSMMQFFGSYAFAGAIDFLPQLDVVFSFYVKMILGLGLIFQMPMLVFFLARFGIVTAGFLARKFRYAALIMVVLAAIITPTSDPVNLAIFTVPMLALYGVSIGVAWAFGRKRPAETGD